jgi:hypothetical protein
LYFSTFEVHDNLDFEVCSLEGKLTHYRKLSVVAQQLSQHRYTCTMPTRKAFIDKEEHFLRVRMPERLKTLYPFP